MITFDEKTEEILHSLELTRENFWNIDRNSAEFLNILIKLKGAKNVLEIGTSNGYSGIWILKALEETKGKLTTIEFWEKRQSIARENFKKANLSSYVECKIGAALVVLEDLLYEIQDCSTEKYDFVFMDAAKKEYVDYFSLVDKMLCDNGVILADNILSHDEKVKPYIEAVQKRKDYSFSILNIGSGMMLAVKQRF